MRVILAGGGHAHLAVLADWAKRPLPAARRQLVTSSRTTAYSGMLPGWLAGNYRTSALMIDLEPLAKAAGAELIVADVIGLDLGRRILQLSTGDALAFDLLSLATGGETDISALAALGDRLLPVKPVSAFVDRWPKLLAAQTTARALNVAVVGGGAAGVELAIGASAALALAHSQASVALVTPPDGFLPGHAAKVHKAALAELSRCGIAVHHAWALGEKTGLRLSTGAFLPADCVIAATGSRAPHWLALSGLACNDQGFVAVGADFRSTSHAAIFAAGDIINRADRPLERSGVHAVKAGPVLAANLRAVIAGTAPIPAARPHALPAGAGRKACHRLVGQLCCGRTLGVVAEGLDRPALCQALHTAFPAQAVRGDSPAEGSHR